MNRILLALALLTGSAFGQTTLHAGMLELANIWTAPQTFSGDVNFTPPGGASLFFNRLVSTSSNTPLNGASALFGPSDSMAYGCVSCDVSKTMLGVTSSNGLVLMNIFKGNGVSGPAKLCDYLGCQLGFGPAGSQAVGSGQSANSDLVGELSFSAATTASYTFVNLYISHPECFVEPQVDAGSTNRHWVTYTGVASFTINFASAVTGNVSYTCHYRN